MSTKATRTMIRFEEALQIIQERGTRGDSVIELAVVDAVGHVLAEDVFSTISMPRFNKSAMDGFAFRHSDTRDSPDFKVVGKIAAGDHLEVKLKPNECVQIMTGAPAPEQCDTVIPIENTSAFGPGRQVGDQRIDLGNDFVEQVRFQKIPDRGRNLAVKGEDIDEGDRALEKGRLILPPDVSCLSTLGHARVKVFKPPTVAFASTGEEVIEPGESLSPGKIYNANAYIIWAMIKQLNCTPRYLGVIRDDLEDLRDKLGNGLEADILILSGGVSMGDFDYVPRVLEDLGTEILFHHLRVKPGKPTLFGKRDDTMVFGLPGNPVSTMYAVDQYVLPAVRAFQHHPRPSSTRYTGELTSRVKKKSGRLQLLPCSCQWRRGKYLVTPIKNNGSADVFSIAGINALAILPEADEEIDRGESVEFSKLFE